MSQRTCVACRQVKSKQELVRLVCNAGGNIGSDAAGKKVGRGAYLCRASHCWDVGLGDNRLGYALRTTLTPNNREQLIRCGEELLRESLSGRGK